MSLRSVSKVRESHQMIAGRSNAAVMVQKGETVLLIGDSDCFYGAVALRCPVCE